ncbi:DUF6759 domain-containing protein [Chryseobacterium sp. HSC-36S06]|uniref:DUF6759 domain-containing protein n=1 Tax=Chryseobacterium sp. HSC-36S06 TaxID=2910970 RepID=UPI00209FBDF7|nr:DUF6759 domain-containing protein [Chryseobacterium sp. HSC-36S06]MCP2038186.1 hypothetical protein [Chryseobacterium sp. HSC-36S06]
MKNTFLLLLGLLLLSSCFKKEASVAETISSDSAAVGFLDSIAGLDEMSAMRIDSSMADSNGTLAINDNQNREMNYSEASALNTSEGWRNFLIDNPEYSNKEEIEEKIIRAEVNEITNDRNTGEMPSAEKIGGTNSSKSKVIIENDTSCDLTIRYSGPDARKITIAPNSKGTIDLGSGNYTVAASACSYNYAGSENLSGDYSVVYYISSVRY